MRAPTLSGFRIPCLGDSHACVRLHFVALAPTLTLLTLFIVSACNGKSSPVIPSSPPPPSPTRIGPVVSGESSSPVSGAQVQIAGQTVMTGIDGTVQMSTAISMGSDIDINASGFLPRPDWYTGQTFALWPERPGFDRNFIHSLVYGYSGANPGQDQMQRIRSNVSVVPSAEFQTPSILGEITRAANLVTEANGKFSFSVVTDGNTTGTAVFKIRPGPASLGAPSICSDDTTGRPYVCGADITIASSPNNPYFWIVITHELTHGFGIVGHNLTNTHSIMSAVFHNDITTSANLDFTAEEKLTMKLMLLRCNGNAYPDDGRHFRPGCTP